jgi:hypothetical protein
MTRLVIPHDTHDTFGDDEAEHRATHESPRGPQAHRPMLTVGELGGVLLAVAIALVATASLALAEIGHHDGRLALGLGLAAAGAVAGAALLFDVRPQLRVDKVEIALVAGAGIAAAFFFLPGFPYASVDKDPGVYVAHAFAIAREGDVSIPDEVLERGLDPQFSLGGRFPGLWVDPAEPDAVTPQFYHLYPATLATADDLVGSRGVFHSTPLLAVISVCLLVLAARRAANTATAVVFGALLVTSMMQVWQAKYPSTEVLAQLLVSGALLGGVLAVERRWAGGALAAGILLGTGFLARPDGFLYILLAVAVVAFAIAARRFDRRSAALGAGLALAFPYAAWNAYELRAIYTRGNSVPSLPTLVAACALLLAVGVIVRALVSRFARTRGQHMRDDAPDAGGGVRDHPDLASGERSQGADLVSLLRRWRRPLGALVTVAAGLVLLGLWYREDLLGVDYVYSHFRNTTIRSLDELNIKWLSWFTTVRGLGLAWLGIAVLALTRTKAALYVLVLPGAVLLPVYLWDARISMRLMWWVRRFVPAVLPALLLLIALAIAFALVHRFRAVRVIAAVVAATLVAEYAGQSLPLRDHHEMAGSWEAAAAVSAIAGGEQGVFLYTDWNGLFDPIRDTPAAVWFIFDEIAARLPPDYDVTDIDDYQAAFPGQPVYLVTHGDDLPANLPTERFTKAGTVVGQLTFWEESTSERPDEPIVLHDGLAVWELTG